MESPESPNRREFLKKLGGLTAGGIAAGIVAGPVSKVLSESLQKADRAKDVPEKPKPKEKALDAKDYVDLKDFNTTIEIEKKILAKLRSSGSVVRDMQSGKIPEEVFAYSREYDEAMLHAGFSVPSGTVAGSVLGIIGNYLEDGRPADSPEAKEKERKSNLFWGSVFGAAMGGLNAAGVVSSQPSKKNIEMAERRVEVWLRELRQSSKDISEESMVQSVSHRIEELTALQKENISTLKGRT